MDVQEILGANVRRLRLAAGMSQEELAARVGVEQFYISGLEAGRRNPTVKTIWSVAQALDVKVGVLFEEVRKPSAGSK
jgi:transcriptional regulator with XRE-family HTH domain